MKNMFAGVAVALGLGAAATLLVDDGIDGCFRNAADGALYLMKDGEPKAAGQRWQMAQDGQTCFIRGSGGQEGADAQTPVIPAP